MPREERSPSAGWREVYRAMGAAPADPSIPVDPDDGLRADGGTATDRRCPDCKTLLRAGAADLCCEAYADRLRAADDGRPDRR